MTRTVRAPNEAVVLPIVETLLAAGVDTEVRDTSNDWSPLMNAAALGMTSVVGALLGAGADVEARALNEDDGLCGSPLLCAASQGRAGVVAQLLRAGARADGGGAVREQTPLMLATRFPECFTLLLGAGASVAARDAHGFTPLHWAAHDEGSLSPSCIEQLHAAGADVDATDDGGFTPLHHAAELGTLKSLEALLVAGASVDAADAGSRSALHEVVVRESTSAFDAAAAAQRLLARGADVNATTMA